MSDPFFNPAMPQGAEQPIGDEDRMRLVRALMQRGGSAGAPQGIGQGLLQGIGQGLNMYQMMQGLGVASPMAAQAGAMGAGGAGMMSGGAQMMPAVGG